LPAIEQIRAVLKRNQTRVIDLFREWDADKDGIVSKLEFRRAMDLLGLDHLPTDELNSLYDEFNEDGSGGIGLAEMTKMLKRSLQTAATSPTSSDGYRMKGNWDVAKTKIKRSSALLGSRGTNLTRPNASSSPAIDINSLASTPTGITLSQVTTPEDAAPENEHAARCPRAIP